MGHVWFEGLGILGLPLLCVSQALRPNPRNKTGHHRLLSKEATFRVSQPDPLILGQRERGRERGGGEREREGERTICQRKGEKGVVQGGTGTDCLRDVASALP